MGRQPPHGFGTTLLPETSMSAFWPYCALVLCRPNAKIIHQLHLANREDITLHFMGPVREGMVLQTLAHQRCRWNRCRGPLNRRFLLCRAWRDCGKEYLPKAIFRGPVCRALRWKIHFPVA